MDTSIPEGSSQANKHRPNLYAEAGVGIQQAEQLVSWLQAKETLAPPKLGQEVAGIGGFAGLFRPDFSDLADPLLVASTDGVGTKVLLACEHEQLKGLGIDLVAMCVNDLYTVGASPLFFLDYYATGSLAPAQFRQVLDGIHAGLKLCQATLLGGETAELPGLYQKGHLDLAGFVVGVVDGKKVLGQQRVQAGDLLIGLASNGFHSNGYALIRRWLQDDPLPSATLVEQLLRPTHIYKEIPELLASLAPTAIKAIAHITGGGILGNTSRIIPASHCACITWQDLPTPGWMRSFILNHTSSLEDVAEVFNLGVGMVMCVDPNYRDNVFAACEDLKLSSFLLGSVKEVGEGIEDRARFV